MGVHPVQVDPPDRTESLDRAPGFARGHREAKLGVFLTRAHVLVRVRLDPRGHPHEHVQRPSWARRVRDAIDFGEVVDDDAMDADLDGARDLLGRLVVAVHDHSVGPHPRAQHDVELATGGHIDAEAFFDRESGHRGAEEGLGGEGDAVVEDAGRFAAPLP